MTMGVRCPKCGLLQLPGPACKSCGVSLGPPPSRPVPAQASASSSSASPPPTSLPPPVGPRSPADGAHAGANPAQTQRLSFHGVGGSLFGIHLVNVFLTIITLGIYYFWAKVRVRNYLFSQTEFAGDRFAYHGTGKELLFGFLKAVALIGVPLFLLRLGLDFVSRGPVARALSASISYLAILVFLAFATVGARRYRLSRTSWRGVRFSFRGQLLEFVKLFVGGSLLSTITLGLYYPFFDTRRHGFLVSRSYFGSQRFSFEGKGKDLFGRFLVTILLSLPTLGLCWFWYLARKQRYFWDHTAFGAARFQCTVTGGKLLALQLGNVLLLVLTLGFGWPWVVVRNARFACRYLVLQGALDLTTVQQEAQAVSTTGEGLAGILDVGFDFGT
jgi:uncharacterized membrane protein YjgN (DUF898 family)